MIRDRIAEFVCHMSREIERESGTCSLPDLFAPTLRFFSPRYILTC